MLDILCNASTFCALAHLDWLGYAASACVLLTFCMQSMLPLRVVALSSNVAFIAYGSAGRLMPILILHCMLLVINSAALVRMLSGSGNMRTEHSRLLVEGLLKEQHAASQHRG
jgi:hypothetical protein